MNKIIKKVCAISATLILIMQYGCVLGFSKNETVFTSIDSTGKVKLSTVNNKLELNENEKNTKIEDNTELENILNTNGEEEFTLKGNLLQWNTMSKDIYYQGNTKQTLPITMDIKYYLNGKEKELKEIEGKDGKITIKIKFNNNLKNDVIIDGKHKNLYTPFVITVGAILDNETNSNVEMQNGKVIDTGTKNLLVGLASPGLYESLKIDELKELDTITIDYDTTNFKSDTTIYILATPKLIEDTDLKIFDKMDSLTDSINELQKNMDKIQSGADKLEKGATELEKGTNTLSDGANEVNKGAKNLSTGAKSLNTGANSLKSGASEIATNLKTVVSSVKQLEKGSEDLDSGLKEIIKAVQDAEKLFTNKDAQKSMKDLQTLKKKNTETANTIENAYKKYSLQNLSVSLILASSYDDATKANLITVKNNYESGLVTLLQANNTAIDSTINNLTTIQKNLSSLENALKQAQSGSSQLYGGLDKLTEGVSKLYEGSNTLKEGASTLANGTNTLSKGAKNLANGTNTLSEGTKSLAKGSKTLTSGTKELSKGITTFNKEGISKLSNYSDKISEYSKIVEELINLSKEYKGFSCNNATVTTFVYTVKGE